MSNSEIDVLFRRWQNIQSILEDNSKLLEDLKKPDTSAKVDDILALAELLAPTLHAPKGWKEGVPLINAFPPAPQPEQMRLGRLSQYNNDYQQAASEYKQWKSTQDVASSTDQRYERSKTAATRQQTLSRIREQLQSQQQQTEIHQQQTLKDVDESNIIDPIASSSSAMDVEANNAEENNTADASTALSMPRRAAMTIEFGGYDSEDD